MSAVRAALRVGLTGGVTGAVMASLVNYAVVGMPGSPTANAINHGTTGLIGGFLSGFFGVLTYLRKASSMTRAVEAEEKVEAHASPPGPTEGPDVVELP
ncbi:hypothetical protein [Streptomyces canus]|uniref:hypothetical protein n=1 Tax=Streptomyces canus TaxID=58343 RepID=UPI0033AFE5F5